MTDAQSIRWAILFLRDQPGLPPEAAQAAEAIPDLLERALEMIPNYANPDDDQTKLENDIETALGREGDE